MNLSPSAPPSVRSRSTHGPAEPAPQSSAPVHTLAPEISALYEPAGPEDFRTRRSRIDRQETQNYGPHRPIRPQQPTVAPYQPPNPDGRPDPEERELYSQAFVVSELDSSALSLLVGLLMKLDIFNYPVDALTFGKFNLVVSFDTMFSLDTTSTSMRRTRMPPLPKNTLTLFASQ